MQVTRKNKQGHEITYSYECIGPDKIPISRYMGQKLAKRRQQQRFNRDSPKVLAKEVPPEIVIELKELKATMPYSSLSRIYGLSPYLIKKVLSVQ